MEKIKTDSAVLDVPYASSFTVSHVFSDGMVLQRNELIRVWGFAEGSENGKKVSGELMGMTADALIENGKWCITFGECLKENNKLGNTLRIYTDKKEAVFANILIGDVYMVVGQSNVAYQMSAHVESRGLDINDFVGDYPLRLSYNSHEYPVEGYVRGSTEMCKDTPETHKWESPTSESVSRFSAIGYLFALDIVKRTNGELPIGVIEIDGNGKPIGMFLPNKVAEETGSDTYDEAERIYKTEGMNAGHARFLYNHYAAPFERFAIAGFIWYQGESDCAEEWANTYVRKFTAFTKYLRSTHNLTDPDFPVYIIEFPSIYLQPEGYAGSQDWAFIDTGYIRAEMGIIPQKISNCYVSASPEVWNDRQYWNNLHPNCKGEQAKKLADLICATKLGIMELEEATGPIFESYEVSEDRSTATLTFSNVGKGLATSDGSKTVKGFAIFSESGKINNSVPCTAEIVSECKIKVSSVVGAIYGVAYNIAATNYFGDEVTLCNSNKKPASAFAYAENRMK